MNCTRHTTTELEKLEQYGVEFYRCPKDNGLWFPEENLRLLKDVKDPYVRWIDVDPWEDAEQFRLSPLDGRVCPVDGQPLYRVAYGDSGVTVDVCAEGHGVWLDEGEFREILDWMHARIEGEKLLGYLRDVGLQAAEVVTGPESLRSEAADVLVVGKLLAYTLLSQFPALGRFIAQLPT